MQYQKNKIVLWRSILGWTTGPLSLFGAALASGSLTDDTLIRMYLKDAFLRELPYNGIS